MMAYLSERERISLLIMWGGIIKNRTMKLGRFLIKLFAMKAQPFRDPPWIKRSGASMKRIARKNRQISGRLISVTYEEKPLDCTIICRNSSSQQAQSKSTT